MVVTERRVQLIHTGPLPLFPDYAARTLFDCFLPAPPMSTDATAPTLEEVEAIIALDPDPILRNLKITQGYYDLSRALAAMLGEENVNWCTFATWASKTAGRFIRLRALQEEVPRLLAELSPLKRWLIRSIDKRLSALGLRYTSVQGFIEAIAADTSRHVTSGNLEVFAELGPLFVALIDTFADDVVFDAARLDHFLSRLTPGPTEQGGQDGLRDAVTHFYRAMFATDLSWKAELILRANAQTGLHEQIRLQDAIHGSINAPVAHSLGALFDEILTRLPGGIANRLFAFFLKQFRSALEAEIQRRWQAIVTRHLMELHLPDGTLHLGRDVPVTPGQPPFPPALSAIEDEVLRTLLARYGADDATLQGSRADDWTDLDERLGYIFELFRSRQQDRGLFAQPFTDSQRRAIDQGVVPDGVL